MYKKTNLTQRSAIYLSLLSSITLSNAHANEPDLRDNAEMGQWCVNASTTHFSLLEFDARYVVEHNFHVGNPDAKSTTVELLQDGKYIGAPGIAGLKVRSTSYPNIEGKRFGVRAAASYTDPICGNYRLAGLDKSRLKGTAFGGELHMDYEERNHPQPLNVARFEEPHFVRLCISTLGKGAKGGAVDGKRPHIPHVGIKADKKYLKDPISKRAFKLRGGCVDFIASGVVVELLSQWPFDVNDPIPVVPYTLRGTIHWAPLDSVRDRIDLARTPDFNRPEKYGEFKDSWSNGLRDLVVVRDLPKKSSYSFSVAEFDEKPSPYAGTANMVVDGSRTLQLHEGGGYVDTGKRFEIDNSGPRYGTFTRYGLDRSAFRLVTGQVEGTPKFENNNIPSHLVAEYKREQLTRFCVKLADRQSLPPPNDAPYPQLFLNLWAIRNNDNSTARPIAVPVGSCVDSVGSRFYAGVGRNVLFNQNIIFKTEFYYRGLQYSTNEQREKNSTK
ncbi:MAG: hypothetical protein RPU64_00585 [Candidatus Sedimenticola sp. (ex Thyasira tokunagai)]